MDTNMPTRAPHNTTQEISNVHRKYKYHRPIHVSDTRPHVSDRTWLHI